MNPYPPPASSTPKTTGVSGPQAADQSDYASYYNSLPASTRAYMHAPGSQGLATANAQEAASNAAFANAGIADPWNYALGAPAAPAAKTPMTGAANPGGQGSGGFAAPTAPAAQTYNTMPAPFGGGSGSMGGPPPSYVPPTPTGGGSPMEGQFQTKPMPYGGQSGAQTYGTMPMQEFLRQRQFAMSPVLPAGGASLRPLDTWRAPPSGDSRNRMIEALMRRFGGRR